MLAALALILFLILLNGIFSMSEIALVSARRARLESSAERGSKGAQAAVDLQKDPNTFLSTVQIGITFIGIISGAFGEAALADDIALQLSRVPSLAPYAPGLATAIVVVVIAYLSLVLGELVPKRVGMTAPETVASIIGMPMRAFSRLGKPIVWFLSISTDLILFPFRAVIGREQTVTEADIKGMMEQAAVSGDVLERERELVHQIFSLGDLRARALMVPRQEIECLEADLPVSTLAVAAATSLHSHFPVCRGGLSKVVGVVHLKDLIRHRLVWGDQREADTITLEEIAQPPLFVPETTPAIKLLDTFREKGVRMALVVDEYGSIEGLVTLNDIVGFVLGRVSGEGHPEPMAVERADGSWLIDGGLAVVRMKAILKIDRLEAEEEGSFDTVGGFVLAVLGHVPRAGDHFQAAGYTFEVVDMDGQRIDKVLAARARSDQDQ